MFNGSKTSILTPIVLQMLEKIENNKIGEKEIDSFCQLVKNMNMRNVSGSDSFVGDVIVGGSAVALGVVAGHHLSEHQDV